MASNQKLSAMINIGGAMASSFKSVIGSTKSQINQVGQTIRELTKRQKRLNVVSDHWQKMGRDASRFKHELHGINGELTKQKKIGNNLRAREANVARRGQLRGSLFDAVALGATLAAPIGAAVKFESVMADVNKVVDQSADESKKMGSAIIEMSKRIPMAAEGLGQIVAAGGQAGFARKELLLFAEDAAKMGVAFDVTASEAGDMMATWRTAFRLGEKDVVSLADKINFLGNTTSANSVEISDVVTRVGALGEVVGLSSGQVAALGGAMVAMEAPPEVAATGIQNLTLALTAGEAATAKQQKAFKQLGFDAGDMAKAMQQDAPKAILTVLDSINKLDKEARSPMLVEIFGKESVKAIAPLLTNLNLLKDNLNKVGDASAYTGSMTKEFEARSKTTENSLILFKNRVTGLGISIGNVLLPTINAILKPIGGAIDLVASATEKFPLLTSVVIGGTAALIGLKVAMIAGSYGFTFLKGAGLSAIGMFYRFAPGALMAGTSATTAAAGPTILGRSFMFLGKAAWGASKTIIRSIMSVGVALLTNPIGALIGGIALVITGAALAIYKYWEPISAFFGGVWEGIKSGIKPVISAFEPFFNILKPIGTVIGWVAGLVGKLFGWLGSLLSPVHESSEALENIGNVGKTVGNIIGTVLGGAIKLVTMPFQLLGSIVSGAASLIGYTWEGIKTLFNWSPMGLIMNNWGGITDFFSNIFGKVYDIASGVFDWIGDKFSWVGDAISTISDWLGFGSDDEEEKKQQQARSSQASNDPQINTQKSPSEIIANIAPARASTNQTNQTYHSNNTITINTQPGQSTQEIVDEIERRQQERQRGALYDNYAMAY